MTGPASPRGVRAASLPAAAALALLLGAAAARGEDSPPAGPEVHGSSTLRYRDRWTEGERDRDLWQILDVGVGDETRDATSAHLSARATADLDGDRGRAFGSLADTFDRRVNALLYTAYASFRAAAGAVEGVRVGRQYILGAETFHLDGVSASTRPLPGRARLRWTAFGGVPVHLYEKSPSGDWIAGLGASAEPWEGGRASLEWAHVRDRLTLLGASGREGDDLETLSLWQSVGGGLDLHGRFSWMEGPREAAARATWARPEDALLVVASYLRLLERERQSTTELDPYSAVLADLERYEEGRVLASLGLCEHWDVEAGASARRLLAGEEESAYNRDTERVHLRPSVTDLPWRGFAASVAGESWSGAGGRIRTLSGDVAQRFDNGIRASVGSDYALYALGPFGGDERTHVRTVYARLRTPLSRALSMDVQYSWEKDDRERFHAISLAFTLAF